MSFNVCETNKSRYLQLCAFCYAKYKVVESENLGHIHRYWSSFLDTQQKSLVQNVRPCLDINFSNIKNILLFSFIKQKQQQQQQL